MRFFCYNVPMKKKVQHQEKPSGNWMRKPLKRQHLLLAVFALVLLVAILALIRVSSSTQTVKGAPLNGALPIASGLTTGNVDLSGKPVIDLSAWQPSSKIDYDKLSSNISGAVIRVQHGISQTASATIQKDGTDPDFKLHMTELQKRGIPVAVYAYVDASSEAAMKEEAKAFYSRASAYRPVFWWIDVETQSMDNLASGIEAFRSELKQLGAANVGIYSQPWFLTQTSIDTSKFDGIWLAAYGVDNGSFSAKPITSLEYGMQQYTSKGSLGGYSGSLDLDLLSSQVAYQRYFLSGS